MSSKDPFRNLFIAAVVVAGLHVAANITFQTALPAFRFHDQIADPWCTWTYWRYAISCTWIIPLFGAVLLWVNYDQKIWYPIQTLLTIAYIGWGIVHVAWMVVTLVNCNDKTGIDFDYPHCVNRNFPAETKADFSFFIYLITISTQLGCTIFWWYFGYQLRLISAALMWATAANISSNINDVTPIKAMKEYHKQMGNLIGNAISERYAQQNNININHIPNEDVKYHNLMGQHIYNKLVEYQNSNGKTGTGVKPYPSVIGTQLGKSINQLINAHKTHVLNHAIGHHY